MTRIRDESAPAPSVAQEPPSGPLVSVLLGARGPGGAGLRSAVLSVLAQSYEALELVVVDDGTLRCLELLSDIDDPRLVRLRSSQAGAAADLNRALDALRGEFVALHESSGFSHPRRLATQVRAMLAEPALVAVLTGGDQLVDGKRVASRLPAPDRGDCARAIASGSLPDLDATALYRRSSAGGLRFEERAGDAHLRDFVRRLAERGPVEGLPECLYTKQASCAARAPAPRWRRSAPPAAEGRGSSGAPLQLCLFGCAPDTGNLGVSALCFSVLSGVKREAPDAEVTVFDNGRHHRWGTAWTGERALSYVSHGGRYSRRLHERSSLWNIRMSARLGGLGNPGALAILGADALLDVSGGDSFTDLYGDKRFEATIYPKRLALELGVPLVLLPQTYGPFRGARARRVATALVAGARMAWARDERSFASLQELLGEDFDPQRHRSGVDLAFGLAPKQPRRPLPEPIAELLAAERAQPVVGINVSGLIHNDPRAARTRYGLVAEYRDVIASLIERFLEQTSARVLLVPHVVDGHDPTGDDDGAVCAELARSYARAGHGERVRVLDQDLDQAEIKGVIARLDWFCGTRMHSTIAALSSGVPVAAIAYSGKTLGVFDSCGLADQVVDPRLLDTAAVRERVWRAWCEREQVGESLRARLPEVLATCRRQMHEIVAACRRGSVSEDREGASR